MLKNLGKIGADDELLVIVMIFEFNGLDDVIWCLCVVDGYDYVKWFFVVDCVCMV